MKTYFLSFILLFAACISNFDMEARSRRCCSRGRGSAAAASFFAGAITGAALAGATDSYYLDVPAYNNYYRGMPRYAYDYPAYLYSPEYAYLGMQYEVYPSFYLAY